MKDHFDRTQLSALLLRIFIAFAATYGLYQLGRAFLHPKQGLDLAPGYAAAHLLLRGDMRFYQDQVVVEQGFRLRMHGPSGPGEGILNFIYPPWVTVAYLPLTPFPWSVARRLWFLICVVCTVLSLGLLTRSGGWEGRSTNRIGLLLPFMCLCFYFPAFYGFMTGQSNDVLLLLLSASLFLMSRERPFSAGFLLSLAALWKPFLVVGFLVFVIKKEYRVLFGALAGGLAVLLISLGTGGVSNWIAWYHQIYTHNTIVGFEPRNHSLLSMALAAFGPKRVFWTAHLLQVLAFLTVTGIVLKKSKPGEPLYLLQFGSAISLGVLLTPKAWDHYGVFLLPLFAGSVLYFLRTPQKWHFGPWLLGACLSVWSLVLQSRDEYELLIEKGWAELVTVKTLSVLLLLLGLLVLVWQTPPALDADH